VEKRVLPPTAKSNCWARAEVANGRSANTDSSNANFLKYSPLFRFVQHQEVCTAGGALPKRAVGTGPHSEISDRRPNA